jgi:hypothetical protein
VSTARPDVFDSCAYDPCALIAAPANGIRLELEDGVVVAMFVASDGPLDYS